MNISVSRKGFYKVISKVFDEIAEIREGYPILIPIEANHQIYINGIMIFLDKEQRHWLSVNSYGQLNIQKEEENIKVNHICFELGSLDSISFLAQSITGEINEESGEPYNEMYRFKVY